MSKSKTNKQLDKHDEKLWADDFDQFIGNLDQSSTVDGAGPSNNLYVGTGNSAANFNVFVNHDADIELGLKIKYRQGNDILPDSVDADGTAHYTAPDGRQVADPAHGVPGPNANRAAWSFDFSVNTGIEGSSNTLDDFDFRIVIESGDGERGVFNLQHVAPGVTPWASANGTGGFADEDGPGGNTAGGSPQISQNSVNLGFGFMQAIFGSDFADAGETYDIQLQAFDGMKMIGLVHDTLVLA